MNTFEQFGFNDPTNSIIQSSVLNNPTHSVWSDVWNGLSGYAIGQFAGVVTAGEYSRKHNQKNQQSSLGVKKELFQRELLFKKKMAKAEADYILESAHMGIQRQQELALKELDNIQAQDKFNDFCQEWNKHYAVQVKTILGELNRICNLKERETLKPKLLIARTDIFSELAKRETNLTSDRDVYLNFCSEINDELTNDDVDLSWVDFWKGKSVSPISDTLNIHYVAQGIPMVLIFPILKNNLLSIGISVWFTGKGLSNIFQNRFIDLKVHDLEDTLVSCIAGVIWHVKIIFNMFFLQKGILKYTVPQNLLQALNRDQRAFCEIESKIFSIYSFIKGNPHFILI